MPWLHVGWALWCTWALFLCTRTTCVRLAAVGYSAGTVLVVVATANHYLLDAVAGAAVIAVAIAVVRPRARPLLPARRPAHTVTVSSQGQPHRELEPAGR
jgi:hypothetical protein